MPHPQAVSASNIISAAANLVRRHRRESQEFTKAKFTIFPPLPPRESNRGEDGCQRTPFAIASVFSSKKTKRTVQLFRLLTPECRILAPGRPDCPVPPRGRHLCAANTSAWGSNHEKQLPARTSSSLRNNPQYLLKTLKLPSAPQHVKLTNSSPLRFSQYDILRPEEHGAEARLASFVHCALSVLCVDIQVSCGCRAPNPPGCCLLALSSQYPNRRFIAAADPHCHRSLHS